MAVLRLTSADADTLMHDEVAGGENRLAKPMSHLVRYLFVVDANSYVKLRNVVLCAQGVGSRS